MVNAGEILYSMFFSGRKRSLSTVMSKRNATRSVTERIGRTETEMAEIEREVYDLEDRTRTRILEIRNRWAAKVDAVEVVEVRLERNDLRLDEFSIVWVPVTRPPLG